MARYPFDYEPKRPFIQQAGEWIGDVFYDVLPEAGFEVRDEQIYMAYQLERAYMDKKTIFAEAGVGTGKTLVYLLYALLYARHTGKPAVIACADESLIEQLVKPEGDIAKLKKHLDLDIDVRLGKSPDQYLCLRKLDDAGTGALEDDGIRFREIYEELPEFVRKPAPMQSFHAYGDRKQYPDLNDEQWRRISWDVFQDCFVCDKRHRCGQTLSRDYFRKAAEIIVCSHDYYMEHVWTYESRKREGQLALLPEHSSVVFDEGHLVETAAMKALGYKLKHDVFEVMITRLLEGEVRETLAVLIDEVIDQSSLLFEVLAAQSRPIAGSDRNQLDLNPRLLREVRQFRTLLDAIEEELVFEGELHTLNEYQLRIVEEHIEMMQKALALFNDPDTLICWTSGTGSGLTLSIMPRTVKEMLRERVFASRMPIVFSSATLSVGGSFSFIADSLGVEDYLSFSVPSPYDYVEHMEALAPVWREAGSFDEKLKAAARLIHRTEGRALVLFSGREELNRFKAASAVHPDYSGLDFLFEGDAEISHLISRFQQEEQTVLCAVSLWEGLDVPGPSLSNVIVWSLPYPPQDPVFMVKRKESSAPFEEVDLPYMLLRLRQGMGRLIRSRNDKGIFAVLSDELHTRPAVRAHIDAVLPEGVSFRELELS
ncbi:ATP-dependent DNA helicase [Paenibacillus tarimensis]|uniref:ATP-dependent DNA helicase n=1 Tax=Paenibacillus tarimensis TaxID=416012 RepID=UPI001F2E2D77|nr:ATP-dependent DNA helicase [Paenibacillus tarimensis]MCF2943019.1 ATP-dependent DNA helicase [Paenibacillus tarimensis]